MKYLSLFSGIAGFEKGIEQAYGIQQSEIKSEDSTDSEGRASQLPGRPLCIGYSEIDKYAVKTYEEHYDHTNYGDITAINATDLPDFDLLVGGFPCQSFSIAGKRGGFNDTRGTLFFDVARILKDKRPRHFILENVKGLLSHDQGKTFQTILGVLSDLGYRVEWQVLNSKNFGVPQNRERIYIIGHLRKECSGQVFPITGTHQPTTEHIQRHITNTLTARYEGAQATGTYIGEGKLDAQEIKQLNQPKHSNDRVYSDQGISPTLNTMQGGLRQPFVAPVLTPDRLVKRQNGRRFKTNGEPAFTLNTQDRHGIYDGVKIRRLTPIECMRLQSFPDDWCSTMSDTQAYKQAGNAVTVNVVQAVITKLKPCLEDL